VLHREALQNDTRGSRGCIGGRIRGWLRSLGLERYEAAFRENEIDDTVLPTVTAEDLKDLGVEAAAVGESIGTAAPGNEGVEFAHAPPSGKRAVGNEG
jgi:hypothetical protein